MNYPDYDTLREEYEAGNITAVDFVLQQSDEVTEDYHQLQGRGTFTNLRRICKSLHGLS